MTGEPLAQLTVPNPQAMHDLGLRIAKVLKPGDLVVLVGPLGAGKTTLARGIGEGLAVDGNVSSPTFVIARTHKRAGESAPMVHVDAYRLRSLAEFDDLDIDYPNAITLVEWGRGFAEGVVPAWLEVELTRAEGSAAESMDDENQDPRGVSIEGFGERWRGVEL